MTQPKDKKRRQKKRPAKKSKGGAPLPKSVQALLKYLGGSSTGIGGGGISGGQPSAAQQFQAAAPPLPQPAGVARAPRKKKVAGSAPVPSPLQGIVPQGAQTTVIQLPAAAPPKQEPEEETKEVARLQQSAKLQQDQIRELKSVVQQQGVEMLFKSLQEAKNYPQAPSLRTSQAPSSFYEPSWAGRTSMMGSQSAGEPQYMSARQSEAQSEAGSEQTIAAFLEQEAAGLGEFMGAQYVQSVSNPVIPEKRMGRGRPAKSEEEKKATRAAAAQRRKEAKQQQQGQQTVSQSLAQLSSLASVGSGASVASSAARGGGRGGGGRAAQIFSQAQQSGADPSSTIRAMAAAGGGAAMPQAGGGLSLGEIAAQGKGKGKTRKK